MTIHSTALLIYCRSAQPWSSFSLPGSDVCCPPLCVPLATSTYVRAFSRPHPLPSQHFILFLSNRCYFSLSRSCTLSDVSTLYHHNASLKCSLHAWGGMQHPGWHHCRALLEEVGIPYNQVWQCLTILYKRQGSTPATRLPLLSVSVCSAGGDLTAKSWLHHSPANTTFVTSLKIPASFRHIFAFVLTSPPCHTYLTSHTGSRTIGLMLSVSPPPRTQTDPQALLLHCHIKCLTKAGTWLA